MPRYLIERTFPDGLPVATDDAGREVCATVVANNASEGVTWLQSYVSADRTRTFCVYEGPDPESIRRSANLSAMPIDQITAVGVLDPHFLAPAPAGTTEQ